MTDLYLLVGLALVVCAFVSIGALSELSLQTNCDGTASVCGRVDENHKGRTRDGSYYFRLRDGKSEIRVVYHPGEPDVPNVHGAQVSQLLKVKPGTVITAYGAHIGFESLHRIDVYSKKEYFVRILSDEP